MRHLVRRVNCRLTDTDLAVVENVLFSEFFILMDLFFLSLLLTIMTYSIHLSQIVAIIIFLSTYSFGLVLFSLLRRWLGD